ncbi:acyl-CoA thioesterase [Paenibacillus aceris]|uniref:Acyl-CoA thioester hydrolase n=1 Tax=Paenibacillus aceris TaxID=869555 RepID=A0ABS4HYE6_9BACL|nr:thioesterase family protein [Paenibacillus aceris]MBP1963663.1 acyl-CoA thioester hydrolase [Paenibacillus aceris]NHW36922.1 acyl-CoA thioesterase [Paenibacillus aceris]
MNEERWYQHQLRVRYAETDQMGVVYHANYLNWFEIGRTELIRELGYSYRSIEHKGLLLPVVEAEVKFKKPARYDDLVSINTRVLEMSSVRLHFAYEIRKINEELTTSSADKEGELLVTGTTRHVWVNPSWKPVRIEKEAPELWQLLSEYS